MSLARRTCAPQPNAVAVDTAPETVATMATSPNAVGDNRRASAIVAIVLSACVATPVRRPARAPRRVAAPTPPDWRRASRPLSIEDPVGGLPAGEQAPAGRNRCHLTSPPIRDDRHARRS